MLRFVLACLLSVFAPVPTASASEAPPLKILGREGQQITAGGAPVTLLGFNRYELAGSTQAAQCRHWGSEEQWWAWARGIIDQTHALGGNVMRMWAFQNYAGPSGRDFRFLDKVFAYARSKRVRIIVTLGNNWGDCDQGGVKDAVWFRSGYRNRYGYALSFTDYVDAVVRRYRNEPAVAMWQVINEGKFYQEPKVLRSFLVDMSRFIKARDPHHLVSSGGALQCWEGSKGADDFESYSDDNSIDVLDHHDYGEDATAWTACNERAWQAAKALKKPLIIGESGIKSNAFAASRRADLFAAKIAAAAQRKIAGYLIWSINLPGNANFDGFDVLPKEHSASVLGKARSKWTKK